jgi:Phage gp6-like head-tail connector protein
MAITNGYATLTEIKNFLSIPVSDTADDSLLEGLVESASRSIDRIANRRFYLDTSATARQYRAYSDVFVYTDDIGTTSSLSVSIDEAGNGTYSTLLTLNTDYILDPLTAAAKSRPFTQLTMVSSSTSFPIFPGLFGNGLRPGVQVTARWGWPSVPDDINTACLILTADLYKRKDAPGGILGLGDLGAIRMSAMGRDVSSIVRAYRKETLA